MSACTEEDARLKFFKGVALVGGAYSAVLHADLPVPSGFLHNNHAAFHDEWIVSSGLIYFLWIRKVIRMPHLIRDVAEEVLKDFLLSRVIRLETGREPEMFSDLEEDKNPSGFFDIYPIRETRFTVLPGCSYVSGRGAVSARSGLHTDSVKPTLSPSIPEKYWREEVVGVSWRLMI